MKRYIRASRYFDIKMENAFSDFIHSLRIIVSRKCNTDTMRFKIDGVPFYEDGYTDFDMSFYGIEDFRDGSRSRITDTIGDLFVTILGESALDSPDSDELRCAASENEDGSRPFATSRTLDELVQPCADYIIRKIQSSGLI